MREIRCSRPSSPTPNRPPYRTQERGMWKACSRRRTGASDGKVHSVIRGRSALPKTQLKLAEQRDCG